MKKAVKKSLSKIKEEQRVLREELRKKTIGYIVAALGLVAGLAWSDAIRTIIEYFFPRSSNGVFAKIVYAVLVTAIVVFVSVYLVRLTKRSDQPQK